MAKLSAEGKWECKEEGKVDARKSEIAATENDSKIARELY